MRKGRDRGMLIYPPARPQVTPIQAAVYLLNRAVRSELVRRQGFAPPRYGAKGVRGCPPIYMHRKSSKNRMGNMNVISMG